MKEFTHSEELIINPVIDPYPNASLSAIVRSAQDGVPLTLKISYRNEKSIMMDMIGLSLLNLCFSGFLQINYYKVKDRMLFGLININLENYEFYANGNGLKTGDLLSDQIIDLMGKNQNRMFLEDIIYDILGLYIPDKPCHFPERKFLLNYLKKQAENHSEIKIQNANSWDKFWNVTTIVIDTPQLSVLKDTLRKMLYMRFEYRKNNLLFRGLLESIEKKYYGCIRQYDLND